jgi:tetratricopeptide (TPR) repeat protein
LRRYEEARSALLEAKEVAQGNPEVLRFLGMTLSRLERYEEAADMLRKSTGLGPKSDVAHEELGRALLNLGQREEAVASLKQAVELNPRNASATATLIRELYRAKSDDVAAYSSRLRELKEQEAATIRAKTLSNFALQAAENEDWQRAIAQLNEAIEACAECPIQALLHKNLGLIFAQSGNEQSAVQQLQRARALDPEDEDIAYALALFERKLARE